MLEGAKDISDIRSHKISYTANGQEYSGKYIFGGVSNSNSIAGGIIKMKKGLVDMQDGKFELIMIHQPKDLIDLGEIINSITFQDYSTDLIEFMQVEEATFHLPKNLPWTLDGEKGVPDSELVIKNHKRALRIIK